jgi:dihydrofolate reductase
MEKVVCGITVSLDGFVAGLNMTEEKPFGDIPKNILHEWRFDEPELHAAEIAELVSAGAYIMGRNMYGPKGEEYDKTWNGWWGENPPYHAPVFVLTHKEREPIIMEGGTTFNFITEGIESALEKAKIAAGDKDVAISGGADVVNQFLSARLIDEIHIHLVPFTLGEGQRLFQNVPDLRLEVLSCKGSKKVTHIRYKVIK